MSYPKFMTWQGFFEKKVKSHASVLDAYDVEILRSLHSRLRRDHPQLDLSVIKADIVSNVGFITDEDLARRVEKLENLGLVRRLVKLS